jgi:hypothetical protein
MATRQGRKTQMMTCVVILAGVTFVVATRYLHLSELVAGCLALFIFAIVVAFIHQRLAKFEI